MFEDTPIRPTVRVVIRKGPRVLVQVKRREGGPRYLTLPGGRQEPGETIADCARRECVEEIGVSPELGGVLHVADVFRLRDGHARQLSEVLFAGTVPESYAPRLGSRPDKRQVATEWVDPLEQGALFLPRYDLALTDPAAPVYLGALSCETP